MKDPNEKPSLGYWVKWRSAANGRWLEKQGEVIEIVQAGRRPESKGDFGLPRGHESYVVHVQGRGNYWPRVSKLEIVRGARG